MLDDFQVAELLGSTRAEGGVHHMSAEVMFGTAVEDSSDGQVRIIPDGEVVNADDEDNSVELPTSPSVMEGDTVMVTLTGGVSKSPMVTAVVSSGDRQNARIVEAEDRITIAVDSVNELNGEMANITSTFEFTADGLIIGKTNSDMKSVFSNDALRFQAGGQDVLVLDAVSSTASADRFGIGKYQWKSVDGGDAIALVYAG